MAGKYTIVRELGRGGMGAVYLAHETQRELAAQTTSNVSRTVVIKEMLDYFDASDPDEEVKARKRFQTEAATLYTLRAANIPQVFDYFSEGGSNFIVMQYIEGTNLESGLTHVDDNLNMQPGRSYPVEQVRRWGIQLCRVLEALTAGGVVHMDIKPANLILDSSDNIWLVDFGTAKAQRTVQSGGQVGMQKSSVFGTAGYAPPEQYNGQAEPRSDVYALAATLYHLALDDDPRRQPFQFPLRATLPPDLRQPLERALEMDVSKRLTAAQLRAALEHTLPGSLAFRWSDGAVAGSPDALLALVDSHWEEARGYFTDGSWEKWFKEQHRYDLVAQMQRARQSNANPDIALDAFVRAIVPAFAPPQLQPGAMQLAFGDVAWDKQPSLALEIRNTGGGCLHGSLRNLPAWLKVSAAEFATHGLTTLQVTVDPARLGGYAPVHTATFIVDAGAGGQAQVTVQAGGPVFVWPGQAVCRQPGELAVIAISRWQEARAYFTQDAWGKWFAAIQRPDLVLAQEEVRKQHQDVDLAMDALLRRLNPALPPPIAHASALTLDFGAVPWQQSKELSLSVSNTGKGVLAGAVKDIPAWLKVAPTAFAVTGSQTFTVSLIGGALAPAAAPHQAQFGVDAGIGGRLTVAVKVVIPEPAIGGAPSRLNLGKVSELEWVSGEIVVRNEGGSRFDGTVSCRDSWLSVSPTTFSCAPGAKTELKFAASTAKLRLGGHRTTVSIAASAGSWQRRKQVTVRVYRPILRHLWPRVGTALDWAVLGSLLGLGYILVIRSSWHNPFGPLHLPLSTLLENIVNGRTGHYVPTFWRVKEFFAGTPDWTLAVNYGVARVPDLGSELSGMILPILPILIVSGWIGVLGNLRWPSRFGFWGFIFGGFALPWLYAFTAALAGNLLLFAVLAAIIRLGSVWPADWVRCAAGTAGAMIWFLIHLRMPAAGRRRVGWLGVICLLLVAGAASYFFSNR
jgi:tRNA A-37 threonylcarbamoyl transferase component Bud32